MPRVKTFAAFALYLYAREQHRRPHVHIEAPGVRATLAIETGERIIGNAPPAMVNEAKVWIATHRDELLQRWKELNP